MLIETLDKANQLSADMRVMDNVLKEHDNHRWISLTTPYSSDLLISSRLQRELAEFLKQKKMQYSRELEEL